MVLSFLFRSISHVGTFQRQFVRCCYDSKQVNYTEFVKWLDEYYPARTETDWLGIMEEDSVFNYQHGNGMFHNEVSVSIESSENH